MDEVIIFISGIVVGAGVVYLMARNNQKKFNQALGIDPKAKWNEMINNLRNRIK